MKTLTTKNTANRIHKRFTDNTVLITLTYDDAHLPATLQDAEREIQKFLAKIKRCIKNDTLPTLKYFYVTNFNHDKSKTRTHHHLFMNFRNIEKAAKMWSVGRCEIKELSSVGVAVAAAYAAKEQEATTEADNESDKN